MNQQIMDTLALWGCVVILMEIPWLAVGCHDANCRCGQWLVYYRSDHVSVSVYPLTQ